MRSEATAFPRRWQRWWWWNPTGISFSFTSALRRDPQKNSWLFLVSTCQARSPRHTAARNTVARTNDDERPINTRSAHLALMTDRRADVWGGHRVTWSKRDTKATTRVFCSQSDRGVRLKSVTYMKKCSWELTFAGIKLLFIFSTFYIDDVFNVFTLTILLWIFIGLVLSVQDAVYVEGCADTECEVQVWTVLHPIDGICLSPDIWQLQAGRISELSQQECSVWWPRLEARRENLVKLPAADTIDLCYDVIRSTLKLFCGE